MTTDRARARLKLRPHLQLDDMRVRYTLQMVDGRWVVGLSTNFYQTDLWRLTQVMQHPQTLEAFRFMEALNVQLAMRIAEEAVTKAASAR